MSHSWMSKPLNSNKIHVVICTLGVCIPPRRSAHALRRTLDKSHCDHVTIDFLASYSLCANICRVRLGRNFVDLEPAVTRLLLEPQIVDFYASLGRRLAYGEYGSSLSHQRVTLAVT